MNAPNACRYNARRSAHKQGFVDLVSSVCVGGLFLTILGSIALSPGPRRALEGYEGAAVQAITLVVLLAFFALFVGFICWAVTRCAIQIESRGEWQIQITDEDFIYSVPDDRLDSPVTIPLRRIGRITKTTTIDVEDSTTVEWCFFDTLGTRYQPSPPFRLDPIFETLRRAAPWAEFAETTIRARDQQQAGFSTARVLCIVILGSVIVVLSMAFFI